MRAVQRIFAIFESFTAERSSLTLQEIADRIDLPKSTAFRIVQSLEQAGYLVRLEDQKYCLSFRFTRLAGSVKSTLGIREIARPIIDRARREDKGDRLYPYGERTKPRVHRCYSHDAFPIAQRGPARGAGPLGIGFGFKSADGVHAEVTNRAHRRCDSQAH